MIGMRGISTQMVFEIDESLFDNEEAEEKNTAHDEKVKHYESMGYSMIEDWPHAKKTLVANHVPGVGPYYVTITNAVPECGNHMR